MTPTDWLLDSDPAIRWQSLRDLADSSPAEVAAERGRVAHEGWGAQLLAAQDPDGRWGGGTFFPRGTGTFDTLHVLYLLGPDPEDEAVQRAVSPVHEAARWDYDPSFRFFDGEVEPCINGRVVTIGSYFGRDMSSVVERLLSEQMADGGWNCEQENGSTRGSFDTSINVLEGLLEYERSAGPSDEVRSARERGEEYLLERRLLHRMSDGEIPQPRWLEVGFPYSFNYDVVEPSTTSGARIPSRTSGWPRRSRPWHRSAMPTAAGRSRRRTTSGSRSSSARRWESRAAGSPTAPSGSSAGRTCRCRHDRRDPCRSRQ